MPSPDPIRAEVADYDREATVGHWDGPRHRMTYRVLGRGRPLVLVPGLASTYRGYAPMLRELARRSRTVVIDYPGEHPDDGARLGSIGHADLVEDLFGLVDHLGLEAPDLFGSSFGSTIVLGALLREPGRFARAMVQGGFARRRLLAGERLALALGRRFPGHLAGLPFQERTLARKNRSAFPLDRPGLWAFYAEQVGLTPIAALSHRLDLLDRLDLRPTLGEIPTPVLSIHGTADRIVPRAYHDELVGRLRRASGVVMEGAGHQPHYTDPEALARLAGDFLAAG